MTPFRPPVGVMELGHLRLYPLLGYPSRHGHPYQSGQICGSRCLDRRTASECAEMGKCESE